MSSGLQQQWLAAREHEARGDLAEAQVVYLAILADDATQAFAWHRLAALAAKQGRYRDAHDAAVRGAELAVAHRRWRALPYLTQQLLVFDEREKVRVAIGSADWSDPLVLSQSAVLAQQLWLADEFDLGLRLVDKALKTSPDSPLLHHVRANLLRYLGKAAQATQAYERCIALAPGFAEAHWALAYHSSSPEPGARVPRLQATLAKATGKGDPMDSVYLQYALFKELDHAGDADAAWVALKAAAGRMRAGLRHETTAERAVVDRLCLMTADAAGPAPAVDSSAAAATTPVFIVGMPRTGTTLLERILGNHSRIATGGELNAFSSCMSMATDRFFASPPTLQDLDAAEHVDLRAVGEMYRQRTQRLYGGRDYLVDKNPLNLFNAGFIARALPGARILCLLRNPMDACFSNLKELFPGGGYAYSYDLEELAAHWLSFRRLAEHWCHALPGQFMTVEYESLVSDPLETAGKVMTFLGLPMEPGCIDITRNQSPVSTASSSQVRKPIHRAGIGGWRRYAHHLQPLMDQFRDRDREQELDAQEADEGI